jgi:hypothetical protein
MFGGGVNTKMPSAALLGNRVALKNSRTGGGAYRLERETSLISMRHPEPRQWLVTIMQTVQGSSGVTPWISDIDGQTTLSNVFTAPELVDTTKLRMRLRWGAGGTRFETEADYPFAGGVFGVTADAFDLDVIVVGTLPTYAEVGLVPVVGGFMVPGTAADPTPLQWRDVQGTMLAASADSRLWAIKPYARTVQLAMAGPASAAACRLLVTFINRAFAVVGSLTVEGAWAPVVTVPHGAVAMMLTNPTAADTTVIPSWRMGLV